MFASLSGLTAMLLQCLGLCAGLFSFNAGSAALTAPPGPSYQSVCASPAGTDAMCLAKVHRASNGKFEAAVSPKALPAGYSPQQFRSAYGVSSTGTGSLAVITAYDNPRAKSDLDTYDQTFSLGAFPNCSATITTACFTKMSQTGSTSFLPRSNRSWALEADLDVQMAHAMCPGCRLTLVEANSNSFNNLMTAVDRAVAIGAHVVSMSWGSGEFSTETSYDSHFAPGAVNFVAASGDNGYGTGWPAASGHVLSAGGTHLTLDSSGNRAGETVWDGTGSGCSKYEAKPGVQADTGCTNRSQNDLSADADPNTGAAIYAGYSPYGSGWFVIGGTSLSTPLLAGAVADAGAPGQATTQASIYGALGSPNLYDVTSGSDGSCTTAYFCTAAAGYDGPSGVGAPIGLGAF